MWPFGTPYPQRTLQQLEKEYDYVIIGGESNVVYNSYSTLNSSDTGGTAGCVLARRLAEDRNCSVLLVERGDARDNWLDRFPLLSTHQFSDRKHSVVATAEFPGNRTAEVISGKGLGGTSRINGMQYTRAVPGEFNAWSQSGRKGWSYDELTPYFRKAEGFWNPETREHYGSDGKTSILPS